MKLDFRDLEATDLATIRPWYADSQSNLFQFPSDQWMHQVLTQSDNHAWVALNDEELVALFQLEILEQTGYFAMIVSPRMRRKGVGKQVLKYVHDYSPVSEITCYIDPQSEATNSFFATAGYVGDTTSTNSQGMCKYHYKKPVSDR